MAVVDLSLNGLISRNLNLKNLSRYILVIEVHVCRNLEQLAYEVRREDIWESLGPSQTTQGGARSASRCVAEICHLKSQNEWRSRSVLAGCRVGVAAIFEKSAGLTKFSRDDAGNGPRRHRCCHSACK